MQGCVIGLRTPILKTSITRNKTFVARKWSLLDDPFLCWMYALIFGNALRKQVNLGWRFARKDETSLGTIVFYIFLTTSTSYWCQILLTSSHNLLSSQKCELEHLRSQQPLLTMNNFTVMPMIGLDQAALTFNSLFFVPWDSLAQDTKND